VKLLHLSSVLPAPASDRWWRLDEAGQFLGAGFQPGENEKPAGGCHQFGTAGLESNAQISVAEFLLRILSISSIDTTPERNRLHWSAVASAQRG